MDSVTPVILLRHAESLPGAESPANQPLTDKGRRDASELGRRLARRNLSPRVWTSPERRALETAGLVFPLAAISVRRQLREVEKPWYPSGREHSKAVACYLSGETVEGWEPREDVIARITELTFDLRASECLVLVSHGVLLACWLVHALDLEDPFSFWSNLGMPDAWEVDFDDKALLRVVT
jgi:broad specificity phosphatase PhoE